MKELKAKTAGWAFLSEPEARWLAVECLLIATRFNHDFNKVYLGALSDELLTWQRLNGGSLNIVERAGYQAMAVAADEFRISYRASREKWSDIHNNDLVPLGRVLEQMAIGSSKQQAIAQIVKSWRIFRSDLAKSRKEKLLPEKCAENWPFRYKGLSSETFALRFKQYKNVLPYVHIYYRNRDYNAWADFIPAEQTPVIPPDDFDTWNTYFWKQLIDTRRIRLRKPSEPVRLIFQ